jgi:hypothetical protein
MELQDQNLRRTSSPEQPQPIPPVQQYPLSQASPDSSETAPPYLEESAPSAPKTTPASRTYAVIFIVGVLLAVTVDHSKGKTYSLISPSTILLIDLIGVIFASIYFGFIKREALLLPNKSGSAKTYYGRTAMWIASVNTLFLVACCLYYWL